MVSRLLPHSQLDVRVTRPLPALLRPGIRFLLTAWSRIPKAPGYLTRIVERWGARLAVGRLECRLSNGMKMRCDLRDHVQRQIYFRGAYEPIETFVFERLLHPGMIVVDAGANVGQYALIAAGAVGLTGEVHAFEPVTKNFRRLAAHVRANVLTSRVRTTMAALWDKAESLELHLASCHVGNDGSYTIGIPTQSVFTVSATGLRLDDYVAQKRLNKIDFIKMDVEGAELFALQGSAVVVSRWLPTMLVEINRDACRLLGYDPEEIWRFLKPYGYMMWSIGQSAGTSHSLSTLKGVERANVVFHTNQLPDDVVSGWTLRSVLRFHRHRATVL